ncbi:3-keto-disaccharide hydrolase [Spirosoma litoris]
MKSFLPLLLVAVVFKTGFMTHATYPKTQLFDGKTFRGWEGDTVNTWRIENGTIAAGRPGQMAPHNDFLCTTRSYANFVMRLKVKLTGTKGFVNAGIQFRSKRLTNPPYEMIGYQADWGPKYWGSLYDESRRKVTLVQPDSVKMAKWVKVGDWNTYEIRAENRRIRLYVNGNQTVNYTELDETIPQSGLIGLQIHGAGMTQVAYKDITLEELP